MRTPVDEWPWPPIATTDCVRTPHVACVFCAPYQFPMIKMRRDGTPSNQMPDKLKAQLAAMKRQAMAS